MLARVSALLNTASMARVGAEMFQRPARLSFSLGSGTTNEVCAANANFQEDLNNAVSTLAYDQH
jgi:hypothetical protein